MTTRPIDIVVYCPVCDYALWTEVQVITGEHRCCGCHGEMTAQALYAPLGPPWR